MVDLPAARTDVVAFASRLLFRLTRFELFIETAHLMVVCFDDGTRETWNRALEHERRQNVRNKQGEIAEPRGRY
jgi:hypothetical protein